VPSAHHPGALQRLTASSAEEVASLSRLHDVTLLHGPHVVALAAHVAGPLVVQTVDPWSLRQGMESELSTGWRSRYRAHKARRSLALERAIPARARLLTVGAADAERWASALDRPVRSIPNGVDTAPDEAADPGAAASTRRHPGAPVLAFVGSLNYGPNVDSARLLVERVAPILWERLPDLTVVVAGRCPSPQALALAGPRVKVLGDVPSVHAVFRGADVAVFPDLHGLGVRNSVLEALAVGTPVVATRAAAREQPEHPLLHVEDTPEDVASRVLDVLAGLGGPGGPDDFAPVPIRTWSDVAADYLDELRTACGHRLLGPP
jgi:glycosyltransferase involved in cell wall biosynthesis